MSALRDLGNEHFKAGKYKEAEQLYTEAILSHSRSDPKVFANRSLTRIRLTDWPGAEQDARKSLELYTSAAKGQTLPPPAMKAHYYLAQALLAQRHVGEAESEGMAAYQMCLDNSDSSAEVLSQFVLRAKQAKWQAKETGRLREANADLKFLEELLETKLDDELKQLEERLASADLGQTGYDEERKGVEREADERRKRIRENMKVEGRPETQERVRSQPTRTIDMLTSCRLYQTI
jgi:STIP1 homology and U-box containing protein 1